MVALDKRKNKKALVVIIFFLFAVIALFFCILYFYSKENKTMTENKTIAENKEIAKNKTLFLERSKKKIEEIESEILKNDRSKNYKPNELETLIAKKIINEFDDETRFLNFDHSSYLLDITLLNLVMDSELMHLREVINKYKTQKNNNTDDSLEEELDAKLQKYIKEFERCFMNKIKHSAQKSINANSFINFHPSSFVYLFCYFLSKSYDLLSSQPTQENLLFENKIIEIIDSSDLGRIFKIYLFIDKYKGFLDRNEKITILDKISDDFINYNGQNFFLVVFSENLSNIVDKLDHKIN